MPELGTSAGFAFYLKDNLGLGHEALTAARNQFLGAAAQSPLLANVRPNGQDDTPQFRVDVDVAKAGALGLSMADINATLSTAWGGQYIDDFIDRGRVKRVFLQADAPFRMVPEDFLRWSVRNRQGEMVPFSSFASSRWEFGSPRLERYNGVPAMEIMGEAAPGVSSGTPWRRWSGWWRSCRGASGRVDGAVVPGARGGRPDAAALHALAAHRVPVPGGHVRELDHPDGGAAGGAAGHPRHGAGERAAGDGARRLLPGGDADHGGLSSKNAILIVEFARRTSRRGWS